METPGTDTESKCVLLDARNICFLCLGEGTEQQLETASQLSQFSLKTLTRFLNINWATIPNSKLAVQILDEKTEKLVPLCPKCFNEATLFEKLFWELELLKVKILASLDKISAVINHSLEDHLRVTRFREIITTKDAEGNNDHLNFLEALRQDIITKSALKSKQVPPKVRLRRLKEKEIHVPPENLSQSSSPKPTSTQSQSQLELDQNEVEFLVQVEGNPDPGTIFKTETPATTVTIATTSTDPAPEPMYKYKCDSCGSCYTCEPSLHRHQIISCSNKEYYIEQRRLRLLQNVHPPPPLKRRNNNGFQSEERNYSCNYCGNTFRRRSNLRQHQLFSLYCGINSVSGLLENTEEMGSSATGTSNSLKEPESVLQSSPVLNKPKRKKRYGPRRWCNACGISFCHQYNLNRHKRLSCRYRISIKSEPAPSELIVPSHSQNLVGSIEDSTSHNIVSRSTQISSDSMTGTFKSHHILTHSEIRERYGPRRWCNACGVSFSQKGSLNRHWRLYCKYRGSVKSEFTSSTQKPTVQVRRNGIDCSNGNVSGRSSALVPPPSVGGHQCSPCGKYLTNIDLFNRHIPHCTTTTSTATSHSNSSSSSPLPGKIECDLCHKSFRRRRNMLYHRKNHCPNRDVIDNPNSKRCRRSCYACGSTFNHWSGLSRHRRTCFKYRSSVKVEPASSSSASSALRLGHPKENEVSVELGGVSQSGSSGSASVLPSVPVASLKCGACGECFTQFVLFNRHIPNCSATASATNTTTSHPNPNSSSPFPNKIECDLCHKAFRLRRNMLYHRKRHCPYRDGTGVTITGDPTTNISWISATASAWPKRRNRLRRWCNACGTSFSQKASLDRHKRLYCKYRSSVKTEPVASASSAAAVEPVECLNTDVSVNDGVNSTSLPPPVTGHQCSSCGECFTQIHLFTSHIQNCRTTTTQSNSTLRNFECDGCRKRFTLKRYMIYHQKNHCPSSYGNVDNVTENENTSSSNSSRSGWKCDACESRFQHPFMLTRHKNMYCKNISSTSGFRFRCEQCGNNYFARKSLIQHKKNKCPYRIQKPVSEPSSSVTSSVPRQDKEVTTEIGIEEVFSMTPPIPILPQTPTTAITQDIMYRCGTCGTTFPTEERLSRHYLFCQLKMQRSGFQSEVKELSQPQPSPVGIDEDAPPCIVAVASVAPPLSQPLAEVDNSWMWRSKCGITFSTTRTLHTHERNCQLCQGQGGAELNAGAGADSAEKRRSHRCSMCGISFAHSSSLSRHRKVCIYRSDSTANTNQSVGVNLPEESKGMAEVEVIDIEDEEDASSNSNIICPRSPELIEIDVEDGPNVKQDGVQFQNYDFIDENEEEENIVIGDVDSEARGTEDGDEFSVVSHVMNPFFM